MIADAAEAGAALDSERVTVCLSVPRPPLLLELRSRQGMLTVLYYHLTFIPLLIRESAYTSSFTHLMMPLALFSLSSKSDQKSFPRECERMRGELECVPLRDQQRREREEG